MSDGKGLILAVFLVLGIIEGSEFTVTLPTFEKGGERFEINAWNKQFKIDTGTKEIKVYPGDKYICEAPHWLKRLVLRMPKEWQCNRQ